MSMSALTEVQVMKRRIRRRLSSPHPTRSPPLITCNPLPSSLAALDLPVSSPAFALASVRVLVLSHLAELERRLSHPDLPFAESLRNKGEDTVEEARVLAGDALAMLRRIRSDVCSHLPDLPFDAGSVEVLKTHFNEFSYPTFVDDIRSHLPDMPEFHMPDVHSRLQGVCLHLPEISVDLSQPMKPMNYLPVLSRHLDSLHTHLSTLNAGPSCAFPSLPTAHTLLDLLDKLLSSDLVPSVLHRVDGHDSALEKAAKDISNALKKSLNGSRLVTYVDLPGEWRNNPWVNRGYRFIPLNKWPIILLSLFAIHNETLNIHTHMIPLLHSAIRFAFSLNYTTSLLDWPEIFYTAFAMLCLFSSVVWHTMSGCAHYGGMELCARVDYVGIGWLISASVGTLVYYGFSGHSQAAGLYLSLCLVTGIAGSIFPFMTWFNDRKHKVPARVAFFVGMAFTGLAPLAHLSYYFGFMNMMAFIRPIIPSFISYIIGLVFYVTHVPERFIYSERISRWTDWLGGGSHAIWHAFIVLAIYQHKWGMRMARLLLTVLVALAAVLGGYYQFNLKPRLVVLGQGRVIVPIGNTKCKTYDDAQACEKIVVHEPTGHVYMACSTQKSRTHWLPTTNRLNATGRSTSDYVAVFDPATEKVTPLRREGFKFSHGLSVHGMDVVPSKKHKGDLYIYLINHRPPLPPKTAEKDGQDSLVEVFRTRPGSDEMHYVVTFKDPTISTPNDIVATGDEDLSFFFTNDHGFVKSGLARQFDLDGLLGLTWSNVGYCREDGCRIAVDNILGANGITKDQKGTYYVASSRSGLTYVLERQMDNSLVITDVIKLDRPVDNLSVDQSGAVWATGLPNANFLRNVHFSDPSIACPSSALRITLNDGKSQYFGEKFKVEKMFEDDGQVASGTTSVAYDLQRKKLYLHGIAAPHLTVCDL
ncbi:hypothetical protein EW145_g5482 [Phellinidium pouzarii]|uniref:SMP-30/Gluconolactonase/LRE-like region domain-containing protein n=1 Tax=Phellinidium pouzarii TaxID=167371 RepID=A0A4S4L0D9_9AGAM|nr:hypothetical protein EW145_g5482 [Phellinidium pouzarii]